MDLSPTAKSTSLRYLGKASEDFTEARNYLEATVRTARRCGASWTDIGSVLGVTKQAAQQRFAATVGEAEQPLFQEPKL